MPSTILFYLPVRRGAMTLKPQPNHTIALRTLDPSYVVYRTRVEDVTEHGLLVAAPIQSGHVVPLSIGTKLELSYVQDSGSQQGRYTTMGMIEHRYNDRIPVLQIRVSQPWERTQERDFVRVDVLLTAKYCRIFYGEPEGSHTGQVTNISGGGFLLVTDQPLAVGQRLWLSVTVDDTVLETFGSVQRVEPVPDTGYGNGVAFEDLDEKSRQIIIQFVFKRQLEQRRKGIGGQRR